MQQPMKRDYIIKNGDYLGYDPYVGYVYSVFMGYDDIGRKMFTIVSLKNDSIQSLISYSVYSLEDSP